MASEPLLWLGCASESFGGGKMSRLVFAALVIALAACASAPAKPVVVAPARAAAPCPIYVVDGAAQPSTCNSPTKTEPAKCDADGPMYVVDGIVRGCAKPEGGRSNWPHSQATSADFGEVGSGRKAH